MDAARTDPGPRSRRMPADPPVAREQREAQDTVSRIDSLVAEASSAVGHGANTLRSVREQYRAAYADEMGRWQALTDELVGIERHSLDGRPRLVTPEESQGEAAAQAGADDARMRELRSEATGLADVLGRHQAELERLDLALRNLESTWLFLKRGDASLVTGGESIPTDLQMRIVEAQEGERTRLAQDIHDGPAQMLSNAIFQVEHIERLIELGDARATTELRLLRELLRRELGSVRTFISQLRPPVYDEQGLAGAIDDAVARTSATAGLAITTELSAPAARLTEMQQTVVLRVIQEALQNVRKHGGASSVIVATVLEDEDWVLTVRDDGRGFDVSALPARGRRNFGLQFMQERAELINARFEVQSRPAGGTVVRLAIPVGGEEIGS